MNQDEERALSVALLAELRKTNELLATHVRLRSDWRFLVRNGVLSGLGGVLGATIVAAILFSILRPALEQIGLQGLIEEGSSQSAKSGQVK